MVGLLNCQTWVKLAYIMLHAFGDEHVWVQQYRVKLMCFSVFPPFHSSFFKSLVVTKLISMNSFLMKAAGGCLVHSDEGRGGEVGVNICRLQECVRSQQWEFLTSALVGLTVASYLAKLSRYLLPPCVPLPLHLVFYLRLCRHVLFACRFLQCSVSSFDPHHLPSPLRLFSSLTDILRASGVGGWVKSERYWNCVLVW